RRERLIDLDGERIAHHDSAFRRADQLSDAIADLARLRHPAVEVPALDEMLSPFVGEHARDTRFRRDRQGAERVAVQIDDTIRQFEERARAGKVGHCASLRSRKRWILPVCVLGSAPTNFTERGYL